MRRPAHEAQADSRVTSPPSHAPTTGPPRPATAHTTTTPPPTRLQHSGRKKEDRLVTDRHAVQPVVTANMACYMSALQKGISVAAVPAQRTQCVRHCSH